MENEALLRLMKAHVRSSIELAEAMERFTDQLAEEPEPSDLAADEPFNERCQEWPRVRREVPVSRWVCRVNRATRTLLIKTHPMMWVAAIILGALHMAPDFRVIWPVGLMALAGTILDHTEERDGREETPAAIDGTAALMLQAGLASRSQEPPETGLRLVTDHREKPVGYRGGFHAS